MSKVKGQGHIKGQNYIFGHNFGSICHPHFQLVSFCSLCKGQESINIQGQWWRSRSHQKVKLTFLSITLALFIVHNSNVSLIIAYWKAKNLFTSKVKDEGQGHMKGQNYIFGYNFVSICHPHFQLVSYYSLLKGQEILDIQGQRWRSGS